MRFLQFVPEAALLGYHQQAERELRLDFCRENGIDVNRRLTGGGALLFQSSCLGWELIAPMGEGPFKGGFDQALKRICTSAAKAYSTLGINATFRPRNDIEVEGRKISGTGGFFSLDGGALFQGTVLIQNEIERFLRALRVPVEKLRKRELDSLMERMAFLEDLIGPVDMAVLKSALSREFAGDFGLELTPGGLTEEEQAALEERIPYFESDEWIYGLKSFGRAASWLREILQTDDGTLRTHLWLDAKGKRVQKALVSGDFFSSPQRLIFDLEAHLMGKRAERKELHDAVLEFFAGYDGEVLGISPEEIAETMGRTAARKTLAAHFEEHEAADLFFVGMEPEEVEGFEAQWLLLPYCSKPVDCSLRKIPDCARCGECQFEEMYLLAEVLDMTPVSIQSFEHLMVELRRITSLGQQFVGSCCEAFYCKHQKEMYDCGAKGVLINLDSTTCYDLGKGMEAYVGTFDHQTSMNTGLITKAARLFSGGEKAGSDA